MALSPGFANPVHDAQHTFRQLLEALSRPGQIQTLSQALTPPTGLTPACAAACLTLLDLETAVWCPDFPETVMTWLGFHTGVVRSHTPESATFAVLDGAALPNLDDFSAGTPTDPEAACTLLVQVSHLTGGLPVKLRGPGILETVEVSPQLSLSFWSWWVRNHNRYPLGVDVFLFSSTQVMGLPRSVAVQSLPTPVATEP